MSSIKEFQHLRIPLHDIQVATNNFGNNNCIGRGGFGKVYSGHLILSGRYTSVAIKRLDTKFGQGAPEFWKEILMLSCYKHENLVCLLGFCDDRGESILVYEYLPNKSLDLYLSSNKLSWKQRLRICIGAARGLQYLHDPGQTQQRVLHRDIKSANILLDHDWNAKISDFGLSRIGPANQQFTFLVSNVVGTMGYCDPLYHETGYLTKESDVYSFGVVLFEVLCGRPGVQDYEDYRRFLAILAQKCYEEKKLDGIIHGSLKEQISKECLEKFTQVAYQCLHKDRAQRPSMAKVVIELEIAFKYEDINKRSVLKWQLQEIQLATNNFKTPIGEGGSGSIYKGQLNIAGKQTTVAVKRLNELFGQGLKEFLTEIQLLTGQNHPNLISLLGYCDEGNEKIIVYEYAERGSLDKYLRSSNSDYTPLTWLERLRICTDAATGLDHLHNHSGKNQTIIHRDIKSANILLDHKWVAKISDLGLSTLSSKGFNGGAVISQACGSPGYCEPEYIITGIVKKESDVYSFGMVLFEVLCGRLCTYNHDDGLLSRLAKDYYEKKKLIEIIDPHAREQMNSYSLTKFSEIAYRCLLDDRQQRPPIELVKKELQELLRIQVDREEQPFMAEVIKKLETGLESQVFDSYEHWKSKEEDQVMELKLPRGNEYIMKMLTPCGVSKTNKKLLHLLHKGILFDNEKRFFSIKDDGMESELMSPKTFLYPSSRKYEWEHRSSFRFSEVARFPYREQLKIRCRISASMLSSDGITYAASLVFSFQREPQNMYDKSSRWMTIKWKCEELNVSSTHCAQRTEDGWMKIRLWHFVNSNKNANFDIVLHKISYFHEQALPDIFIHGIEFHAVEMVEGHIGIEKLEGVSISNDVNSENKIPRDDCDGIINRTDTHLEYTNQKQLYLLLCDGILIDNGQKWFSLCKSTGGKCHMLPATKILSHDSKFENLDMLSLSESRFKEVVQLEAATTYALTCEIESSMVSPGNVYACYLVFKFAEAYIWHDDKRSVMAHCYLDNTDKGILFAHLNSREPINIPTIMPKDDNKAQKMSNLDIPTSNDQGKEYKDDDTHNWMELRNDGWMEFILCKSLHKLEDHKHMSVILTSEESDLYGIIVQGIEFRPYKRPSEFHAYIRSLLSEHSD
ncbi:hypothetical protein OSB04_014068 [Centaurea solstitialis]|uniref:Protein kinase domain-containing protein n=1 Tax=Centaurea solstitialis TaxID=347529 RepID=A0AA38TEG2_9ASTR|nr:hypothetical protein OSB04_014068 [Centaurea solstitialis]